MTTRRISEPGDVPFRPARARVPHQARVTFKGGITPGEAAPMPERTRAFRPVSVRTRPSDAESFDLLRRVRDGLKRI